MKPVLDITGYPIQRGDVVWIAVCHGSSAASMEQRRVLEILPPLKTWSQQDNEQPRLRVRYEEGLIGAPWMTGRPSILSFPQRCLVSIL